MTTVKKVRQSGNSTTFVREWEDEFLGLWPHRFDFLHAEHPFPNEKPNWITESRHPLSDRLIRQGAYLYGVRFGPKTQYAMLDIDIGSPYHPEKDPLALSRITEALEELGLVTSIPCLSSSSGGIHLYFPFTEELPSWKVGVAVTALLENKGFKVAPGLLEVFPNSKPFSTDGKLSLYNGHRLPLQQGSYLLSSELHPLTSNERIFIKQWQFARARNIIDGETLEHVIKTARRKVYRVSGKAQKFLNDLNAEIEPGWSGAGQTNRLIGRIAMRAFVFGHVLLRLAKPLAGEELIEHIVSVAKSLPGFSEFCDHISDIKNRAKEWARCVENSHYYPYGASNASQTESSPQPTWNSKQRDEARERIQSAVGKFLTSESFPAGITDRFQILTEQGISGSTLYKHKDLWHPSHIKPVEIPPDPPNAQSESFVGAKPQAAPTKLPTSLLGNDGCNAAQSRDSGEYLEQQLTLTGCNALNSKSYSKEMTQKEGLRFIRSILNQVKRQKIEARQIPIPFS